MVHALRLVREVPISLGYRVRTQQVFFIRVWPLSIWKADPAVDIDPGDVDAVWSEVARQRLRQPAFCEISWTETRSIALPPSRLPSFQ